MIQRGRACVASSGNGGLCSRGRKSNDIFLMHERKEVLCAHRRGASARFASRAEISRAAPGAHECLWIGDRNNK